MPMYEYECEACGFRFEQIQKFSDLPVELCPSCGAPKVRKLVSSPAIQFKGSGFYINDYARKGATGTDAKESASKESSKDSPKESSKESKTSSPDSSNSTSSKSTTSSGSTDSGSAAPSSKDS